MKPHAGGRLWWQCDGPEWFTRADSDVDRLSLGGRRRTLSRADVLHAARVAREAAAERWMDTMVMGTLDSAAP